MKTVSKIFTLVTTLVLFLSISQVYAQSTNLIGKIFQYINIEAHTSEQYTFISNNKAKLIMSSEFSGTTTKDECLCQYFTEGNKVRVICECEDKSIFPDPLKEIFIYDNDKKALITTIHYDRNKKPRIFILKF